MLYSCPVFMLFNFLFSVWKKVPNKLKLNILPNTGQENNVSGLAFHIIFHRF